MCATARSWPASVRRLGSRATAVVAIGAMDRALATTPISAATVDLCVAYRTESSAGFAYLSSTASYQARPEAGHPTGSPTRPSPTLKENAYDYEYPDGSDIP